MNTNPTTTAVEVAPKNVHSVLGRTILADGLDFVLDLENSKGSWLVDARDGRKYLDLFTFFASNPIGMNHPALNNPAFIEKIGRIALHKPSNSDVYTVEMAEFVETFHRTAMPDGFPHAFFISGGSLAVENALKTAIDWKVRLNIAAGKSEKLGTKVLHFEDAFHGRSGYTMSLTNTDPIKTMYWPKFEGWPRVSTPFAEYPLEGENLARTEERERITLQQINAAFEQNADDIACIIIEPIQGEGGDNHFRPEFLSELRNICDEKEAMLIFDEVQSGVGLTGQMWAFQAIGVTPDIVSFGKKAQVCGIMVSDRVDIAKDNVFAKSSRINSTWGGNLVDMVRFQKFLEVIEEENLVENARTVGAELLSGIEEIVTTNSEHLSNARGLGLMCSLTASTTELRDQILKSCWDRGLMIIGAGKRTIRFRPPLNLSSEEAGKSLAILKEAIAAEISQ